MSERGRGIEDVIELLTAEVLLDDLVVRSPKFKTKSGKELEAADILIACGKKLVPIQVRTREATDEFSATSSVELQRIQKRIDNAVEQVKTLQRGLDSHQLKHVTNRRGIQIDLPPASQIETVGIVVVDIVSDKPLRADQQVTIVRGFSEVREIPVHIFTLHDFREVVAELSTLPDLLAYLRCREFLMRSAATSATTTETDVLALFQTRYDLVEALLRGEYRQIDVTADLWADTRKTFAAEFARRESRRALSKAYDGIIANVHTCIGYALEGHAAADVNHYIAVAAELSMMRRVMRLEFAEKMGEKLRRAETDRKGCSYFVIMVYETGVAYLFLASRDSREDRVRRLELFSSALYVHLKMDKLVGIATEPMSAESRSFDFAILHDVEFDDEAELSKIGASLLGARSEREGSTEW